MGNRHPAPAVVAGAAGIFHLGAPGRPAADADGAAARRTSAARPTGAAHHPPLRPPFFQAITLTSAGATSSAAVGWNSAPCSFFRTSADGFRWPFMTWERCPELMPDRRATSFWLMPEHGGGRNPAGPDEWPVPPETVGDNPSDVEYLPGLVGQDLSS